MEVNDFFIFFEIQFFCVYKGGVGGIIEFSLRGKFFGFERDDFVVIVKVQQEGRFDM